LIIAYHGYITVEFLEDYSFERFIIETGSVFEESIIGRQGNRKNSALARLAFDVNTTVMGFTNGLDKTQSEAEALLRPGIVASKKPIPDFW